MDHFKLEADIIIAIKQVYDPEIPVNVYDLGLIYKINIDEDKNVEITMTLTAPNCHVADDIMRFVQEKVEEVPAVQKAIVNLVFEPTWSMEMMSDEAKLELGYM
jgi:FeS assembly SUF system protein